jgi:hypothetical protein
VATRSHTTFKKRQKELARVEKQRDKAEQRAQRKLQKTGSEPEILTLEEAAILREETRPIDIN